jgi:hypothetical protein
MCQIQASVLHGAKDLRTVRHGRRRMSHINTRLIIIRNPAPSQARNQTNSKSASPPPASAAATCTTTPTTATATSLSVNPYLWATNPLALFPQSVQQCRTSKSATKSLSKSACPAGAVPAAQKDGTTFAKSYGSGAVARASLISRERCRRRSITRPNGATSCPKT